MYNNLGIQLSSVRVAQVHPNIQSYHITQCPFPYILLVHDCVEITICVFVMYYRYRAYSEQCAVYQQQCCDHHGYWNWQCCSDLHNYPARLLFIQ